MIEIGNGRTMTRAAFAGLVAVRFVMLLGMTIGPTLIAPQRFAALASAILITACAPCLELLIGRAFATFGMVNTPGGA